MTSQPHQIAQELLEHQAFVRRLAMDLVGEDADDLVQDVWRRTLERPPHHGGQLRAWLARVTRNLAANQWRDEARRRARDEERVAEYSKGEEVEARLELRKEIVEALEMLNPCYRRTILLRYFEGFPPSEIAARENLPVSTIKKRLRRALEQLRDALDRRHANDRTTWTVALAAMTTTWDSAARLDPVVAGGIAMGAMTKVAGCVVVAAACAVFVTRTPHHEPSRSTAVETSRVDLALEEPALDPVEQEASGEAARSTPAAMELRPDPAAGIDSIVLRVTLEGIAAGEAARATVTVTGPKESGNRRTQIKESWRCQGLTTEFRLDTLLARLGNPSADRASETLTVVVDHPLHFSESTEIALSSGVKSTSGRTVYEVPVQFVEAVFWPRLTLAVLDADTRAHLENVELRCVPTAFMGSVQQPGSSDPFTLMAGGLSSPIGMRGGRRANEPEDLTAGVAIEYGEGAALRPAERC
ncbi:MAG: sigma-70 family RNA polymerase sigma factor [Planctomycetota bacterium]